MVLRTSAATLADVRAGEVPPVKAQSHRSYTRLAGKLGSKSLRWPGGLPGQIRQGGEQVDGELRQRKEMGGEVAVMRFLLGFILGAFFTGNRVFRAAFLLIILFILFCLYRM